METAVLPARDHLAEHQYRHHTRALSGLVSPAGANPRSRRKAGKATPPAVIASMVSDAARMCLTGSFGAPNSAADLSSGVFRGASAPASPRGRFPGSPSFSSGGPFLHRAGPSFSSAAKSSSHGLHHGPVSSASLAGQYYGSGQGRAGGWPRPASENSSGTLERMHSKKASEKKVTESIAERSSERVSERRSFDKRVSESGKSALEKRFGKANNEVFVLDRKAAKPLEAFEKKEAGDRKFGGERKVPDRERASSHSENHRVHGAKVSKQKNVGAPPGAITILKRPQTKEAAAENLAIITGVPLAEICMKNGLVSRQPSSHAEASTSAEEVTVSPPKRNVAKEKTTGVVSATSDTAAKNVDIQQRKKVVPSAEAISMKSDSSPISSTKAELPPTKESASLRESEVARVTGFSLEKAEAQQDPAGGSALKKVGNVPKPTRIRHTDSRSGLQGEVDGKRKGGDSPAKESARLATKFLERTGSLTLVSPAANSMKSGGGSFGFIDVFHDIPFFAPRSPANERWAGPAYSNSPPPSSLPFPTFSLQKLRDTSSGDLDLLAGEVVSLSDFPDSTSVEGSSSSSAPSSPSRGSLLLSSSDDLQHLRPDVSFVTRDLRRMLNLDLSGNVELSGSADSGEIKESLATQGLKRILQLG